MSTGVPLSEPPKGDAAILPHEKVFPIQIGSQLFRLSGASIASDGIFPCSPRFYSSSLSPADMIEHRHIFRASSRSSWRATQTAT